MKEANRLCLVPDMSRDVIPAIIKRFAIFLSEIVTRKIDKSLLLYLELQFWKIHIK